MATVATAVEDPKTEAHDTWALDKSFVGYIRVDPTPGGVIDRVGGPAPVTGTERRVGAQGTFHL